MARLAVIILLGMGVAACVRESPEKALNELPKKNSSKRSKTPSRRWSPLVAHWETQRIDDGAVNRGDSGNDTGLE